jgi:parallel beta-helix repeat protein
LPKRTASAIILIVLLNSLPIFALNIRPVKAEGGTIYIRADGSIDPPTAPIQQNVDIYTLTGDIASNADGIIIDGAGYTVQGNGALGKGFILEGRSHVTIKNAEITNFPYGIWLWNCSSNSIYGNNVANNSWGILLNFSSNNTLSGNNVANNYGIGLGSSSNNTLSGNNVANNGYGILLDYSSSNNTLSGNNVANNGYGILLDYSSSNNTLSGNNVANNGYGILLGSCSDNFIFHNSFVKNIYQALTANSTNIWDDGYPSGGNFWSDYKGTDLYSGPYQNVPGSDGIGDAPYVVEENNTDHYPLMKSDVIIIPPTVSPTLQKVIPGGGTAYTISLISSTYSVNLSLSTLPKGINGYFVPTTVGGATDFSYSTLFISTSTSTPTGTYAIDVTATLNDPQQTSFVAQATLQVMGGIIIAVNDGGSWPTEKPIIGAKVIVDSLSGVTGASGTLTFPSLSTGNHNVTISAKGYSGDPFPHAESLRVYENQYIEVSTPFKAYLYPLRYTLTIHVRDQFGQPVDGAQGTIYDSSGNIYGGFATPLWGDLTLLFQPVMTGMTMIVSKYGYQSATASYDITSDTTLNIVMYKQQTPSSSLTVHVEDAQTGVAISGATALVGDQSEITDRLGNAQFSLPPQEYVVTVSKAGYATAYARITLSSNHPAITIRILLTPQVYGLFVHVQDSQSSPISGATVTIPGIPEQFTDNGGDAVFMGLKSGSYTIAASKSGYISSSTPTNVGSSSVRITIALHIANVPDFLISVWPSYESVRPGSSASYSITLSSINGFSESVELSLGGMTISGAAIAFSPSRVQLSQGGTASSTLTISTTSAIVPGDYSLNVQGWYAGSLYGSIVHSTPVALKVDLSQYKVSITHKSSSDEPVCYLFQTTTFNVEVADSSSGQYVDPSNYGASFDGSQCNLVHPSVGHFAYTTEPFTAKQIGQHDFTYHCSSAPGTSFISSDSVLVRLHKNEINLVFSTQEQYFPVDGMFFDDDNDISNNAAKYLVGTKPSLVNAYYYLASDASNYYVIEYWTYYAYNKYTAYDVIPDNHEHDFESIYVWVDKSTHLVTKMILSQHSWVNKYDSSIPLVISLAVEEGGHGTIMAHAQGNSYIFDEPSNAVSMPPFKGDFIVQQHGSSSAVIPLNPAYYYAEGYSIKGFGDQSTLTYGLNYDAIWPFVGDLRFFSSLGAKFGPVGFVVGTFSGITYAVFWDREVFRIDVLSSQHPFSVPTLTGSIKFYITAPWGRAAFIDPDIEDHKGGYVPTDPVKFVKDFPKAYVSNLVRIFRNVFPDMWVPQITISIDPINVSIIDSQGRVLGNKDGSFVNEIVGGQVLYSDDLLTILSIANATDNYTIELASISTGKYTVKFSMLYSNAIVDFEATDIPVEKGSVHAYTIDWHALANGESGTTVFVDQFGTGNFQTFQVGSNLTGDQFASLANMSESPRTTLTLTQPNLVQQDTTYVSTATQFILFPSSQRLYQQTDGFFFTSKTSSDIAGTFYRIYNSTYDIGWQNYTEPFCLWNLQEGNYTVEYYSTDKLNDVEPTNTMQVTLHRPRVSGVTTDKNIVGRGLPMSLNVTVTSQVDCLETLNITIFANETLIGTLENVTLASGESATMTFAWNTTEFAFGNFVVGAHEQPSVFGENSTAENPFYTRVVITIRGDTNGDFTVDIYDAILLSGAFNSRPMSPNWNANADLNSDNIVDIYDAIILSNNFGKTA